ncbi:MAG: response regulator [Elusimicrobia bacterium]|nr:response regulator [Elusimicrobiota bacterium]
MRGCKILLVDDDPLFLELIAERLTSAGAEVRTATNAVSSFKAALEETPDLIITDVNMPGFGNGLDSVRCIREQPRLAKVPVIIVSGLSEDRMKHWDLQGIPVLQKPPVWKALEAAILKALASRDAA